MFNIYGHDGHLAFRIMMVLAFLSFPKPMNASYEIVLAFEKKKRLKVLTYNGRKTEAAYHISLLFFCFLFLKYFMPLHLVFLGFFWMNLLCGETLALSAISSASHLMSAAALSRI